jgi:hypothetical protein
MTRAWIAAAMVVMSNGAVAAPARVIAYALPVVCFESTVNVHQLHDEDDAGYRAHLTFTYRRAATTASVPTEVGYKIIPRTTYRLCATQVQPEPDMSPILELVEIWRSHRLVWSSSYDFPVTQTLAWTKDGRALLVEFGRAMDEVWGTSFPRGLGTVSVAVPPDVPRVGGTGVQTIVVRVAERAAGATLELVAIIDGDTELWRAPGGLILPRGHHRTEVVK